MYVSRRDYVLRLIEEITQMIARIAFKRERDQSQDALQLVVQACERLFGMEADKLFQFTPEQHWMMLSEGEAPEAARDKILVYAALHHEAGRVYVRNGNAAMARGSFVTALRLTLKAERSFAREGWPDYAPKVDELLAALNDAPLEPDLVELLRTRPPL